MRLPALRSLVACLALAAVTALGLTALAGRAADPVQAPPLSSARPDPAVRELIRAWEAGEKGAGGSLMSYWGPNGQPIYLVTAPCCDHFNPLYDAEGRRICAPTGGFGGAGDGTCPGWVHDENRWRKFRLPQGARAQHPSPSTAGS